MASPRTALTSSVSPAPTKGPAAPDLVFDAESAPFRAQYNRASFVFTHRLAGNPLFEIPNLARLSTSLYEKGAAMFCAGNAPVNKGWKTTPSKEATIGDAIARIDESGSWVLLKSVQEDPDFAALLDACVRDLSGATGVDLEREITWLEAYVFIASPRSITPYHIDHESNVLLQVKGEKDVNVFDPFDRSILTEDEIERYYLGDLSAATYKVSNQSKADVYRLTPGTGVHIPVRAPHWVRNGDESSVSFSINFCMREPDREARVFQANRLLRGLGLSPRSPGASGVRDAIKATALGPLWRRAKPETKYELLRGGLDRWPMRLARRVGQRGKTTAE